MDIAIWFEGRWVQPHAQLIQISAVILALGIIQEYPSRYEVVRILRDLVAAGF